MVPMRFTPASNAGTHHATKLKAALKPYFRRAFFAKWFLFRA
jgi:hypothetical protein